MEAWQDAHVAEHVLQPNPLSRLRPLALEPTALATTPPSCSSSTLLPGIAINKVILEGSASETGPALHSEGAGNLHHDGSDQPVEQDDTTTQNASTEAESQTGIAGIVQRDGKTNTNVWYFAFGANLSEKKFVDTRGIKPLVSIGAMLPGYKCATRLSALLSPSRCNSWQWVTQLKAD